jgi:hypothetical protein
MDYIIDPMWFYWLHVISGVQIFVWVLGMFAILGAVIAVIGWGVETEFDDDRAAGWRKVCARCCIAAIPLTFIAIFIPSRETMISMMVAKYTTYSNAQLTVDAIKSAVDYIVQAMQSVGG